MAPLDPDPHTTERQRRSHRARARRGLPLAGLATALIFVNISVAALIVGAVLVLDLDVTPEIITAVVLVVGVIGLISALAVLVGAFHRFGLESRGSALGLPDGSVQAVIALTLILIFAIVGVYLHATSSAGDERVRPCLTRVQLEGLGETLIEYTSLRVKRPAPPCTTRVALPAVTATPAPPGSSRAQRRRAQRTIRTQRQALAQATRQTVLRYDATVAVPNQERENITSQLLTTVATLVVAVAGFYFGAKAVQAGAVTAGGVGGAAARRRTGTEPPPDGDEAAYGERSPVTDGPSPEAVREELDSAPLAEEDEAEESVAEQLDDAESQHADQQEAMGEEAQGLQEEAEEQGPDEDEEPPERRV
jgi:hypothetical protein